MVSSGAFAPSSGGCSEPRSSLHLENSKNSPNTSTNGKLRDVDIKNRHDVHLIPENALEVKVLCASNSGGKLEAHKEHGDVIHKDQHSFVPPEPSNPHEILSDHASTQYTSSPTYISPISSTNASIHTPRTLDHAPQLATPPVSITTTTSAITIADRPTTSLSASTAPVLASSSVLNHVDSSAMKQSQVITSAHYIKNPTHFGHSRGDANFAATSSTRPEVRRRSMKETGKLLSDLLTSGSTNNWNSTSILNNKRHHPDGFFPSSNGNDDVSGINLGESRHTHNDLPLKLRNKRMKPTDCLLFAATLLSEDESHPIQGKPMKTTMVSEIKKNDSSPSLSTRISTIPALARETYKSNETQKTETPSTETDVVVELSEPRDVDVLCGRGGLINKHPGNIVYRKVVDYNKPFYQSVHKKHRILVSQSIVQSILNFGGRFLILGSKRKSWTEIGYKKAVQKTSQALRERTPTNEEEAGEDESYLESQDPYHEESDGREEEQQQEDCLSEPVNDRVTLMRESGENQKRRNFMLAEEGISSETEVQAV